MNVTYLNPAAGLGGAERCLLDMIVATRRVMPAFQPSVILLTDGPLGAELRRLDVPTEIVQMPASLLSAGDSGARSMSGIAALGMGLGKGLPAVIRLVLTLRSLLEHNRPKIIHSNGFKTHLLTRAVTPVGCATLCHAHDFVSGRPLVSKLLSIAVAPTTHFIANSRAVADDVRRIVANPSRVSFVYNGIDTDAFIPAEVDATWLDRAAGTEPSAAAGVRVGLVATYALWKGQDVFIRAVSQLPAVVRDAARFYIVGGPIYQTAGSQWSVASLQAMARQCGVGRDMHFVPFQSDAVKVMQSLDVVVHASTQPEPFGRTIVEAMACGKAVIAAFAGGVTELFSPGVHALAVAPGDVSALASAITRLVNGTELRRTLGRVARPHAVAEFGLPRLGEKIFSLYSAAAVSNL